MRETFFSLEHSMNIHLLAKSIYSYSFVKQSKTDFIIDCLFRDSCINEFSIDPFVALFTGNRKVTEEETKTYYRVFPLHPDKPLHLTPEQESYFTEGIVLRTTVELRDFYSRLKQGLMGSLTEDMFTGVIISITETTEGHNNTMIITLNLKKDRIISFGINTDYRELDSFSRGKNYRPFNGVNFQIKEGLHFCFTGADNNIGVAIHHSGKSVDYSLAMALKQGYHTQYQDGIFQRWVRNSIIILNTDHILSKLYYDTDKDGNDFLQCFKFKKQDPQQPLQDILPLRYTINEKVNTIFERNLENFTKEYGSIAAAAIQRARAKEK